MADKNVAIRKRQQIENAGKVMFIWVALAAVIVGMSAVVGISLFQRIVFNQRVINEQNNTVSTLKKNNELVDKLKENVRVLNTNEALLETPRLDETEPISVILDGLPAQANSSALGASLQQRLLCVDGVTIDSLTVNPVSGVEDEGDNSSAEDGSGEITFQFTVSAAASQITAIKEVLKNFERSIRVIDITSLTLEQQNNQVILTGEGRAFYQPETKVELTTKEIKP